MPRIRFKVKSINDKKLIKVTCFNVYKLKITDITVWIVTHIK